jgi:chlorite dismutase
MNELYRYLTVAVSSEWRLQDERRREEDKAEFISAAQSAGVAVHGYSLVGTRADADLLLWIIADELDAIRTWETRCAATRLWARSTRPYAYLAARRPSPYLGEHRHAGGEGERHQLALVAELGEEDHAERQEEGVDHGTSVTATP